MILKKLKLRFIGLFTITPNNIFNIFAAQLIVQQPVFYSHEGTLFISE